MDRPGVQFGSVDYNLSGHFMQLVTNTIKPLSLAVSNRSVVKQTVFTVRLIFNSLQLHFQSYSVIRIFW